MQDAPHAAAEPLASLLSRRSVSPRRLTLPAPTPADVDSMIEAALRAPDHGGLRPWRIVEFPTAERAALAHCFEQEKLRRDPLAPASDLARARSHAMEPPALLGFVVCVRARSEVPVQEQWLCAGAALGNLLNAAHQLGFGAGILSGERCFDAELKRQLDIGPDESLAGFVSIGTVAQPPAPATRPPPGAVHSCWTPTVGVRRQCA